MKIVMICGSPRPKNSTSLYLLNAVKEKLENSNEICVYHALNKSVLKPLLENLPGSNALVIACPLYVDSIPSNLLEVLAGLEEAGRRKLENTKLYLLVNNGFYDAAQNGIAIDMLWDWCDKCGLQRGCAVGIGAGEMVQAMPLGKGPMNRLGKAVVQLAHDIQAGNSRETVFIEPNFPRVLYRMAGHIGWRKHAKRNGLKASELRRKEAGGTETAFKK